MSFQYKPLSNEDRAVFSVDALHKEYWPEFCDVCYSRFGYESEEDDKRTYEQKYETFCRCHTIVVEHSEWGQSKMLCVRKDVLERFGQTYDIFTRLTDKDNATIPMLLTLLRMEQSIINGLKQDQKVMDFICPRECNIDYESYIINTVTYFPKDETKTLDLGEIEKHILDMLLAERPNDVAWEHYIFEAQKGHIYAEHDGEEFEYDETAGAVASMLAGCLIDEYNYALREYYMNLDYNIKEKRVSVVRAFAYRLFMYYQTSLCEIKQVLDEYPSTKYLAKLQEIRDREIETFKQTQLGEHWCDCITDDGGLAKFARYMMNHRDSINEKEEIAFFHQLDKICIIEDILSGKADKYWLKVKYPKEKKSSVIPEIARQSSVEDDFCESNLDEHKNKMLQDQIDLTPFDELIDKGDWQEPATAERVKAMMRLAMADERMKRLVCNGRSNRVKVTWQNLVGYFSDRKMLPASMGSPALNKMFFGDQEGYPNIDKGRPSRDNMSAGFRDVIPLLDSLLSALTDKKA